MAEAAYMTLFDGVRQTAGRPNGLTTAQLETLSSAFERTTTARQDLGNWRPSSGAGVVFDRRVPFAQYDPVSNTIVINPDELNTSNFVLGVWLNIVAHEVRHALSSGFLSLEYVGRGAEGLNNEANSLGAGFLAFWEASRSLSPGAPIEPGPYTDLHNAQISAVRMLGPGATSSEVLRVASSVALNFAAADGYFERNGFGQPPHAIQPRSASAFDFDGDGRVDWISYFIQGTQTVAGHAISYSSNAVTATPTTGNTYSRLFTNTDGSFLASSTVTVTPAAGSVQGSSTVTVDRIIDGTAITISFFVDKAGRSAATSITYNGFAPADPSQVLGALTAVGLTHTSFATRLPGDGASRIDQAVDVIINYNPFNPTQTTGTTDNTLTVDNPWDDDPVARQSAPDDPTNTAAVEQGHVTDEASLSPQIVNDAQDLADELMGAFVGDDHQPAHNEMTGTTGHLGQIGASAGLVWDAATADDAMFGAAATNGTFANVPAITIDPLVLDLNGDGVRLTSYRGRAVFFDVDHDGAKEQTGWVARDRRRRIRRVVSPITASRASVQTPSRWRRPAEAARRRHLISQEE